MASAGLVALMRGHPGTAGRLVATTWLVALAASGHAAETGRREMNNGQLLLEGVPEIPVEMRTELYRYQDVRAAAFRVWSADGKSIYVSTGFGNVDSIHRVDTPLGARRQQTFFREPIGEVLRRPGSEQLFLTRDVGGNERSTIFSVIPGSAEALALTDQDARDTAMAWDRQGRRLAYQSTSRDGRSNDIWIMSPGSDAPAEIVLASPDGSWWGPVEFSRDGRRLLAMNYVSVTDSRSVLIDLDDGTFEVLAGGQERPSVNQPVAFDDERRGFWVITDQGTEFSHLGWQPLARGASVELLTGDIPWNVTEAAISPKRDRLAFIVNEGGRSQLYLMDAKTRRYQRVETIPTGIVSGILFSPDSRKLGMTINTAKTPSDAFVLSLGRNPLQHGRLRQWTESEVGGLDSSGFVVPELVQYPSFDGRDIPAWIQKPVGEGPFPVIVRIHGGPESMATPAFNITFQMWIATVGAAVIQPNVRGSAGFGKTYVGLDDGRLREDAVRDIGALLDWIERQPDLDASRVALYGGSYGGYMVLAGAVQYSDRLRAAVDYVGISNLVTFLENTEDYRRDLRRREYGDERDPEMRAFLQSISPLNDVDRIRVPMLVIQGENDPRVPASEARQIVDALRSAGRDVWYINARNEGHGFRKRENRDVMQQAIVMFFRQHLAGGGDTGQ